MDKPSTSLQAGRKPSIKQQKAIANLVENGGNVSKAMLDAGYSPATAKTPQKLTESEYVQAMMVEVGLTDIDGFKLLKEGMAATKTIVMGKEEDSFVDIQPDFQTRHKYLETFMRVRGIGGKQSDTPMSVHFHNHQAKENEQYGL